MRNEIEMAGGTKVVITDNHVTITKDKRTVQVLIQPKSSGIIVSGYDVAEKVFCKRL